jgi:hypothetical protein
MMKLLLYSLVVSTGNKACGPINLSHFRDFAWCPTELMYNKSFILLYILGFLWYPFEGKGKTLKYDKLITFVLLAYFREAILWPGRNWPPYHLVTCLITQVGIVYKIQVSGTFRILRNQYWYWMTWSIKVTRKRGWHWKKSKQNTVTCISGLQIAWSL